MLGKTAQTNTAHLSPTLVFWNTKLKPKTVAFNLTFLGIVSIVHIYVQVSQYREARNSSEPFEV